VAIKNFWSLTVDEAIVADEIKCKLGKSFEVFFPTNSQLKDVDLIVFDLKNKVSRTVQVKGSRTYGEGDDQYSWSTINKESVFNPKNKIDFFIFVVHYVNETETKKAIKPHFIVVPSHDFREKVKEGKKPNMQKIHCYFSLDLNKKRGLGLSRS